MVVEELIRAKPPPASIIEAIMNKAEPQLNVKDVCWMGRELSSSSPVRFYILRKAPN